jgi:FkbH-like protein
MQPLVSHLSGLNWLPIASDFRGNLRAALNAAKPTDCLHSLARLASHRIGFLETIQLDRALARLSLIEAAGFVPLRLAVLASSTVDHLLPAIRVAGLRRGLLIDVYHGTYGQYRQDILEPTGPLAEFAPQTILFSLTAREALSLVPLTAAATEVEETISRVVSELRFLWKKARGLFNVSIIQQNFMDITEPLFGSYDCIAPAAPARVLRRLNDQLYEAAENDAILILDIARPTARGGLSTWFDPGRWFQGKLEVAPEMSPLYGDFVARILAAERGLSKKCLVFDLDNTLWGGVVGDEGIEGIILGRGSALGEAYLALQCYAKQLSERGVILAVCSKNDQQLAEAAFDTHPEMLLRRSDVAVLLANWDDKVENLQSIATRLNIGVDSLVFVDDNPVERARVRQSLPMVAVPELPEDPAQYACCLADAGYFEAVAFTSEDRQRSKQYAANTQRQAAFGTGQDIGEFLQGLAMSVAFGPFSAIDHARIVQLINRTNQFNTTTRRYTSEEITYLTNSSNALTLQFRLFDRFGDNGLVSTMILRPTSDQEDVLEIESWVMSCRVFGRRLEFEAMNIAVEVARQRGMNALVANYIPTSKNRVISGLYQSLGFVESDKPVGSSEATRWYLDVLEYVAKLTHISRTGAA